MKMKKVSLESVAWFLSLALALFITGLAGAFYTGRLAVVTVEGFARSGIKPSGTNLVLAQCTRTTYRTYGGETEIFFGQSVDAFYKTTGGIVTQHANLSFGGAPTTTPVGQWWWGNVSYHGRKLDGDGDNDPNWVTFACLNRARYTS